MRTADQPLNVLTKQAKACHHHHRLPLEIEHVGLPFAYRSPRSADTLADFVELRLRRCRGLHVRAIYGFP